MKSNFLIGVAATLALLRGAPLHGQQTLHLVYTAIAYPEDEIYRGCQQDEQHTVDLFTTVGDLARAAGHDLSVRVHRPGYDKQAIVSYLDRLPTGPGDAVVFMFSGHGLKDPAGGNWPLLYYCEEPTEALDYAGCGLSLERIHRLLKNKGVRMSLVLASSCNHDPLREEHEQTVRTLASGEPPPHAAANYDFDLFTEFRGHVLASASKAGQKAYLTDELGSYFVHAFLHSVVDGMVNEDGASWADILRRTDERVRLEYRVDQNAQYRVLRPTAPADDDHDLAALLDGLAYLLLDEAMTGVEDRSDEEQLNRLEEVLLFYDELLVIHHPEAAADRGSDNILRAYEAYGTPAYERAYERAVLSLDDLPPELYERVGAFLNQLGE